MLKKALKITITIIATIFIIVGFLGFFITTMVAASSYQGDKIKAPSNPISFLYFLLLILGLGLIFALYHKNIIAFFKSISPKDQSKDKK